MPHFLSPPLNIKRRISVHIKFAEPAKVKILQLLYGAFQDTYTTPKGTEFNLNITAQPQPILIHSDHTPTLIEYADI